MPKGQCDRPAARTILERTIRAVASECEVDWVELVRVRRGRPAVAEARRLAMAVSVAAGVPPFLVARMFSRAWSVVDKARAFELERCRLDAAERDRFIRVLHQALEK